MYSDKVEVLRFETEPYRKQLDHHNGSPHKNGALNYNNNNNSISNHHVKFIYQNGYHNHSSTLIETTETKSTATTQLQVKSPSDPAIASVLHPRHNPRPGRILLENVNNRPQTMDRGTQANTATTTLDTNDTPSTSNEPTNNELYRNANISVNNQKLLSSGGVSSSADSLNSADSAKRDNEDSVHESVESNQPMISKDNTDGHPNMSNGDGKFLGVGSDKPSNGIVKEYPVDDDADKTSCGMECLYFAMQCCECTIM